MVTTWVAFCLLLLLIRHLFDISKVRSRPTQPTAVIVAAYLQNEVKVIEASLASFLKVKGVTSVHLAWNGPSPTDPTLLTRIRNMGVQIHHVEHSKSKAENLNHVLKLLREEYVIICDADDILYPHALQTLFAKMEESVLCVQGMFTVATSGNPWVWFADIVEQSTILCLTSILSNFFIFKGHNGLWRKRFLLKSGFDPQALTEDFEMSIRAHEFGEIRMVGITGKSFAPPSFDAYFNQRSRWMHGGLCQWKTQEGIMFSLLFGFISYALYKVWWSSILFTFLLTQNWKHALSSFVGLHIYIITLPYTFLLTFKRILLKDNKWNVTPRLFL
jgi:cellulose synthase/poly-beta-1,6-N-acetylglucosamine synthase-like glycosyltransferase